MSSTQTATTDTPTDEPTTNEPSENNITNSPTQASTEGPTASTPIPTELAPTAMPSSPSTNSKETTDSPSSQTQTPVGTTEKPSVAPTFSPAPSSSFQPSFIPTPVYEFDKISLFTPDVIMDFELDTRRLIESNSTISDECVEIWQTYVTSSIGDEVKEIVPLIDIRSALKSHDVNRYIEGPFDSETEKDDLIQYLRTSECPAFGAIRSVTMVVPDRDISGVQENPRKKGNSQVGMIVGLGVAILAIVMLTGAFLYLKTRNRRRLLVDDDEEMFDNRSMKEKQYEYVSEIGCTLNQEISTLGDPIPPGTRQSADDLSTLESTCLDYDYQRAFMDVHTSAGISEITENNFLPEENGASYEPGKVPPSSSPRDSADTDPAAFTEEHYEVLAPPGVLGLIIESSKSGGYPTVHSIKRNSVLAGVVKQGDRIVSIDDQEVGHMIASDASRLIAAKKDQPVRTFVFGRMTAIPASNNEEEEEEKTSS
jgi:hypothetical protein